MQSVLFFSHTFTFFASVLCFLSIRCIVLLIFYYELLWPYRLAVEEITDWYLKCCTDKIKKNVLEPHYYYFFLFLFFIAFGSKGSRGLKAKRKKMIKQHVFLLHLNFAILELKFRCILIWCFLQCYTGPLMGKLNFRGYLFNFAILSNLRNSRKFDARVKCVIVTSWAFRPTFVP